MDNIYPEIVKWSSGKPTWLQDALRRFVLKGSLEQEDLEQLTAICKSARGINVGRAVPRPVPLTAEHVPDNTALGGSVALSQLRNFRGVNRISTDAVLNLKPTGLNVIYGDNGAGKTGYIRVLKKLRPARGSDKEIYQNALSYEEEEQGAQGSFTEG